MAKANKARKKEDIKIKLAEILRKHVADPKIEHVTIVDLKLSPDSMSATVFFALFGVEQGDIASVTKSLNAAAGFMQKKLATHLKSRNTPKLNFVYDRGFDHANKIEDIIQTIHQNEPSNEEQEVDRSSQAEESDE